MMGQGGLVDSDAELRTVTTLFIGGGRLHKLEAFLGLLSYCPP